MDEIEEGLLRNILSSYHSSRSGLIPILLEVQAKFSYLPEEAIQKIASFLNITEGELHSVASFYNQFRLTPVGRRRLTVCRGTACHIHGAPQILSEIEKAVDIKEGETTPDLEYTLESVACIGCCALAPCMKVNDNVHGEMTPQKTGELISDLNTGEQGAQ
jgi:NADH-quinone oxidoreductase subunit E